jgi:A/G-specific adenine glycosylase
VRYGAAFILTRKDKMLLVRRAPSGLLGGMMMPPTSQWRETQFGTPLEDAPLDLAWEHAGEVRHVFTHFALKLGVWRAEAPARTKVEGEWLAFGQALAELPTVGRKAAALALDGRAGVTLKQPAG